jgi:hypothetical protein
VITSRLPTVKARFVDTPSPEPFWRVLHRLADAAYPDLRAALETVLTQAGVDVSLELLARYLATGPATLTITTLEEAWRTGGAPALAQIFTTQLPPLVAATATATARTAGLAVAFEVTDPVIVLAVEAYGAEHVTAIAETTREAIRAATSTAFQTQQTTGQLAHTLRDLVGLTPRQAVSVVRYGAGLEAEGLSPSQVETLIARQTMRLIRRRAEVIARQESLSAANLGQHLLWQQAQAQGLVSAALRRYWLVTPDDRLCAAICRPIPNLNANGVGLDEPFQTPVGAVLFPPAHILCRCAAVLASTPPEVLV